VHSDIDPAQRVQRFERWDARYSLRWPLSRVDEVWFALARNHARGSTTAANRLGECRGPHGPARDAEVNLDLLDGRRTWGTAAAVRREI
jgi:hypothetical protein